MKVAVGSPAASRVIETGIPPAPAIQYTPAVRVPEKAAPVWKSQGSALNSEAAVVRSAVADYVTRFPTCRFPEYWPGGNPVMAPETSLPMSP
jgi:hypothetical protein